MKLVIYCLSVALLLVSCTSTPPVVPPQPQPEAPIQVVTPETPVPDWTGLTFLDEAGKHFLVVTGSTDSSWAELLADAVLKATGEPNTPWVNEHSVSVPAPDFVKNKVGWWKVEYAPPVKAPPATPVVVEVPKPIDPALQWMAAADAVMARGDVLGAVNAYLEAATRALDLPASEGSLRFPEFFDRALAVVGQLSLTAVPATYQTKTGTAFDQPFQVKVTYKNGSSSLPVASAPLRFSIKLKKNGRMTVSGQTLITDASGVASFTFPVPDFSAQDELVAVLDINNWLEKLVSVPRDLQPRLRSLETLTGQKRVTIPYKIESVSKSIPLSVSFADYDEKGGVLKKNDTLNTLVSSLSKSGYTAAVNTNINLALLKKDDKTVLLAWLSQGKKSGRAAFGTSTVAEVTSADKKFTATVNSTLKVYDLETQKLVHQQKGGKTATANDRTTAISQALSQLANDFVAVLNDELP